MNTTFRKLLLATAIASGLALSSFAGAGTAQAATVSQEVTDARQESQIWTTYALSPYLRANDLSVTVTNGKAVLTGKVEEEVNKDLAKQIALGVSGITTVDNQIVVQADYTAPARPADRRYGEVVDDATISAAVRSKLLWSRHVDASKTEVKTNWGKVTLGGNVASAADKDLAGRLALNTRGVVSVNNQLVVASASKDANGKDAGMSETMPQAIADTWITTKVKSTFMYSSNVDSSDITVDTADGNVTLSGKVNSGAERALAIELAKNVRGVKSVSTKGLVL
jgi:osmotically-inducible protein OsmY